MKPITKHLIKAAFILAMVAVASLGIRHVCFRASEAGTVDSTVIAETKSGLDLNNIDKVIDELNQRNDFSSGWDNETPPEDNSELNPEPAKDIKAVSRAKSSKGSKGLEKISLGDNEDLYITKDGELWYVSEKVKMQVQIDRATGRMNVVDVADRKAGSLQPIPMGDGHNIYITDEGQTWYVGDRTKSRVEVDDTTGEITILEQYGDDDKK